MLIPLVWGLELSPLDKFNEKWRPEHRKHTISERWYEYDTTNNITTSFLLLQMQR